MKLIGIEVPDPLRPDKDQFRSFHSAAQSEIANFIPSKHGKAAVDAESRDDPLMLGQQRTPVIQCTETNEESLYYEQQKKAAI